MTWKAAQHSAPRTWNHWLLSLHIATTVAAVGSHGWQHSARGTGWAMNEESLLRLRLLRHGRSSNLHGIHSRLELSCLGAGCILHRLELGAVAAPHRCQF